MNQHIAVKAKHAASTNDDRGFVLDRRDLLKTGALGFVACIAGTIALPRPASASAADGMVGAYIQILPSGSGRIVVTLYVGAAEMGQGIMTGLAQLVCEEMKLSWSQIRVEHAPVGAAFANPIFKFQGTGGSTSMMGWYYPMRNAAAAIREVFTAAYIANYSGSAVNVVDGVFSGGSASASYSDLISLVNMSSLPVETKSAVRTPTSNLSDPAKFLVIGKSVKRPDIPDKVTGKAIYGIDVNDAVIKRTNPTYAGKMLYAAVQHCPTIGGKVGTMPTKPSAAKAIVNLGNAVAIVANDTWSAMNMASSLKPSWVIDTTKSVKIDSANISATSNSMLTATAPIGRQIYDLNGNSTLSGSTYVDSSASILSAMNTAPKVDSTYILPHVAHACMEPLNCTVWIKRDSFSKITEVEVWAPTQAAGFVPSTVVSVLGALKTPITVTTAQVKVNTTMLGGGLGRKFEQDFIGEAVAIAATSGVIGTPVKLTWSRKEDFQNDKYRPTAYIRVRAGWDKDNKLVMLYRSVASSINVQNANSPSAEDGFGLAGATNLPYPISAGQLEFVPNNVGVPLGYWRSVGESYNTFAIESAIDEMAGSTSGYNFRRSLLQNSTDPNKNRAIEVLDAVYALTTKAGVVHPAGGSIGYAFMRGFGSLAAMAAEVTKNATTGKVVINNIFCAIDCGVAINPDQIQAQLESAIIHGLSATLWGQVTFTQGRPNVTNFNNYPLAKLRDVPSIYTSIISSLSASPGGVGETAVPLVAPAIANAFARLAGGARIRTLPFYPGTTLGGL